MPHLSSPHFLGEEGEPNEGCKAAMSGSCSSQSPCRDHGFPSHPSLLRQSCNDEQEQALSENNMFYLMRIPSTLAPLFPLMSLYGSFQQIHRHIYAQAAPRLGSRLVQLANTPLSAHKYFSCPCIWGVNVHPDCCKAFMIHWECILSSRGSGMLGIWGWGCSEWHLAKK